MDLPLDVQQIGGHTVVGFRTPSLMDPPLLTRLGTAVHALIDDDGRRHLVLDFGQVQYLSSQAMGLLVGVKRGLDRLPPSSLALCCVGPTLMQLLKLTGLDRVMTIVPNRADAVGVPTP